MSFKENIKNRIEDWLREEERSQAYLARKAEVSPEQLNRILHDKHEPTERTVNKLLSVIN
mgnify:CR=1 FL=1